MIYDGFFDRYKRVKIIASHAGGALPLVGRLTPHLITCRLPGRDLGPAKHYFERYI